MRELTRNPWLRAGLLAAAAGLAVYGLVSQWHEVHDALTRLAWYDVAGAAACAIAGLGCMMLAWRALLAGLGSPLPVTAAIRVMSIGQLGKYVPGAVWALAAQVELARDYDVPRRRSTAASLVAMAVTLVVGLIAAGVMLPLTSAHAAAHYWWVLAVTPLAAACLHPRVIKTGLDLVLKVLHRDPLEESAGAAAMARALAWTALGWLFYGAHAWFLISDFRGGGAGGRQRAHLRAGAGRVRAGLGGRVPDHLLPGRHRAAGGRADRRAGPGHAVRVGAGGGARVAGGDDDRGPGVGRGRAGHRTGARPRRQAGRGSPGAASG